MKRSRASFPERVIAPTETAGVHACKGLQATGRPGVHVELCVIQQSRQTHPARQAGQAGQAQSQVAQLVS